MLGMQCRECLIVGCGLSPDLLLSTMRTHSGAFDTSNILAILFFENADACSLTMPPSSFDRASNSDNLRAAHMVHAAMHLGGKALQSHSVL
jgi:hypothetical protein